MAFSLPVVDVRRYIRDTNRAFIHSKYVHATRVRVMLIYQTKNGITCGGGHNISKMNHGTDSKRNVKYKHNRNKRDNSNSYSYISSSRDNRTSSNVDSSINGSSSRGGKKKEQKKRTSRKRF